MKVDTLLNYWGKYITYKMVKIAVDHFILPAQPWFRGDAGCIKEPAALSLDGYPPDVKEAV